MKVRIAWALAAGASSAGIHAPSSAQVQFDEEGRPAASVAFGDLDLRRQDDRRILSHRIESAVYGLCGRHGERTLSIVVDIKRCQRRTLESARSVVDQLVAAGTRSNAGADGAKLVFSPCEAGRGRVLRCDVRPVLSSGTLSARPSTVTITSLAPGFTAFGDVGHAYRPPDLPDGPRPLVVLLHGAGDDARRFLDMLRPIADERGLIMASAKSLGATWDIAAEVGEAEELPDFGPDVPRIDAMLREIFARASIDPRQVVLVGFSDGASYALSLGLANPDVFPSVVALSPGFVKLPANVAAGQRVFIAHGRRDRVIPIETAEGIAAMLKPKLTVRLRPFDGEHGMSRPVLLEGLDFALSKSA